MVKNIVISLLITKVLLDNVMLPCSPAQIVCLFISTFMVVWGIDITLDQDEKDTRRKKR